MTKANRPEPSPQFTKHRTRNLIFVPGIEANMLPRVYPLSQMVPAASSPDLITCFEIQLIHALGFQLRCVALRRCESRPLRSLFAETSQEGADSRARQAGNLWKLGPMVTPPWQTKPPCPVDLEEDKGFPRLQPSRPGAQTNRLVGETKNHFFPPEMKI